MSRYNRVRRDIVHAPIVAELRALGVSVTDLAAVGNDVPDLVVGWRGVTRLVELKSDRKIHKQAGDGRSPGQIRFADAWAGSPVVLAQTTEQVLKALETSDP